MIAASLTNVHVTFPGGVQALTDVTASLPAGTITGLVGESGSGKTTLCRVLAGLQPPTRGQAQVAGLPVTGLRRGARTRFHRTVQMLLQDAPGSLSPRMTVGALLREVATIHRLADGAARQHSLMGRLGLPASLLDRYPHQLSGGQARRVAMARALMLEPQLLIADEPTAGLDLSVQAELLNLLQDLQATLGLTMLVSSHNLGAIRRIASHTIVMYLGQVVEHGPTADVFEAPAHPYTAALLSAHPALDPARRRPRLVLHGEIPSTINPPGGCRFHTRCFRPEPRCRGEAPVLRALGPTCVRCHYPVGAESQKPLTNS